VVRVNNKVNWKPIRKVVAVGLSAVTSTGLLAIAHALGLALDPTLSAAIVGVAGTVAGYLMPGAGYPHDVAN
jgi:hypothetical protein